MRCISQAFKSKTYIALAAIAATQPASAALIDFDANTGGAFSTGEQLGIAAIGSGNCVGISAGGSASDSALCGGDFNGGSITPSESFIISNVNFDQVTAIDFSLAARANTSSERFEPSSSSFYDFFEVKAAGERLAIFEVDPNNNRQLFSTELNASTAESGAFQDFSIFGSLLDAASGIGDLEFVFQTTGTNERLGLDTISISSVPLPSSSIAFLGGLSLMAAARRMRRGHTRAV